MILAMCYILFLIEQIDAPKEYIPMYTSSTITCTRGLTQCLAVLIIIIVTMTEMLTRLEQVSEGLQPSTLDVRVLWMISQHCQDTDICLRLT